MIRAIIGFALIAVSCVAYSSLHSDERILLLRPRHLIVILLSLFVLVGLEGLTGIMIYFGLDRVYHAYYFYIPVLLAIFAINLWILFHTRIKIGRECIDVIIHAIALNLLIYHLSISFTAEISALWGTAITLLVLLIVLILIKYSKEISSLIELIDLTDSFRVFAYASVLIGFASICMDFVSYNRNSFLIPSGLAYSVWVILLLREIYTKCLKPLSRVRFLNEVEFFGKK